MDTTATTDPQNGPKPVPITITAPPPNIAKGPTGCSGPGPCPAGPTGPTAANLRDDHVCCAKVKGPTAAAVAPIVEHLADRYGQLKRACYELLDNIKKRAPAEDRTIWRCPDFQRICNLIDFK